MIETVIRCEGCGKMIEDDFDECCEEDYTELFLCWRCEGYVEELEDGMCHDCSEEEGFEQTTWGQHYGYRRI